MNATLQACAALILVALWPHVRAADWKPLRGTYAVSARSVVDPPVEEPKDSHFRIQLSGDAAKDLYRAMKVAERRDECTGAVAKRVGEMQCLAYQRENRYECHFAIDVMRQKIEHGVAC